MEFAAIQSQRRLQGVLQKKRDEARRRKEAAEKRSRVEAEAKAEAERLEAAAQKKRQVESMLVMIEQGIRTFGYVAGVTTAQIRAFFAATYAGVKINDELFRAALQKGVHDRRLRHGTRRGKLDVNSYLLFEEMEKPARGVEGLLGQLKSASKQKRFIQPLIVGFWFLVWTSMELNQDFRIVQQLMHSFDDPFDYALDYTGPGTCRSSNEVERTVTDTITSAADCREACMNSTHCFATDFDTRCHFYGDISSGSLPLAGGAGCYNKIVVAGGPNPVVASFDLRTPEQYLNWTCVDVVAEIDEDNDGQAELSSYHAHCLAVDPIVLGGTNRNVTVPYISTDSMFSNVDSRTCRSNSGPANSSDAIYLQNMSIGEAVWGRVQTADEVYNTGHQVYCGSKNTEFFCLLNVTSQGMRYPCKWNPISRVCQRDIARVRYDWRATDFCSSRDGDQERCNWDIFSCDWQGCVSGPTCQARLIGKEYPDEYTGYFEVVPTVGNCSQGTELRGWYDNATSFLEESMVWWATRNGSSNSMDRRTIWSDAFGALHMSMGSPCLEWDDGGPCTEDTCSCRTEYPDNTLTLDLQSCNMSGLLFELEAATVLSSANADVVVLLVFLGGWIYKLIELAKAPKTAHDAFARAQIPSIRRADAIMESAVRFHTLMAVVRLCCYTQIAGMLQCFGFGSSDLAVSFATAWRFEWWLVPVNTWGQPTFLQAVNAQRALLVYNWFRQSLFDLFNTTGGRSGFRFPAVEHRAMAVLLGYGAVILVLWAFLAATPLLTMGLFEVSHSQWLSTVSEFPTANTGQHDITMSVHAAHFVTASAFSCISLFSGLLHLRRTIAKSMLVCCAASDRGKAGRNRILPVAVKETSAGDAAAKLNALPSTDLPESRLEDGNTSAGPSTKASQSRPSETISGGGSSGKWGVVRSAVMGTEMPAVTDDPTLSPEDQKELENVRKQMADEKANLKSFRMAMYSYFSGSYHTLDNLGVLQAGRLCQQFFYFAWAGGAVAAAILLMALIGLVPILDGPNGNGPLCEVNIVLVALSMSWDIVLLVVGVLLNFDCCSNFKEKPFVSKKQTDKILQLRLKALLKLQAIRNQAKLKQSQRGPHAARTEEDLEIQRRRELEAAPAGPQEFNIPLQALAARPKNSSV